MARSALSILYLLAFLLEPIHPLVVRQFVPSERAILRDDLFHLGFDLFEVR